ncbi:MAG: glycosyltransferase family 4 protein [Acidimicrobiia bacterium]
MSPYSLSTPGGVQGQVLSLARALRELGVQVRVLGPCDGPPPEPGVISVGPSTKVPSNGSISPIAASKAVRPRTLEALRTYEPDVVHLHEPLVPGANMAALLASKIPTVGTFHAAMKSGRSRWYTFFRPAARSVAANLTIRTAVSDEAMRLVVEALGGEYLVIPNGVEVDRFADAVPWPVDRRAILFVGRHEERKGLGVLLDAFEGIDRDVVLWVAGEGPETAELRARKVAGVEWLGRVGRDELARRLRAASAFCAPSLGGESFGIVLVEAMAARTPVVASDIPGYRDVARAGREALLVAPGDSGALRAALQRVLDRPEVTASLVDAGIHRATDFSIASVAEQYLPVYEEAVRLGAAAGRR